MRLFEPQIKKSIKIGTLSNIGTFPFVYISVYRTCIISNVNIDITMLIVNHGKVTRIVGTIQMKTLKSLTSTKM